MRSSEIGSFVLISILLMAQIVSLTTLTASSNAEFTLVNTYWSTSQGFKSISPGDVLSLTVALRYEGSSQAMGLTAKLTGDPYIEPYGEAEAVATYEGMISRNSPLVYLNFQLYVLPNASIGTHNLILILNYTELNASIGQWVSKKEIQSIKLPIAGRPKLSISTPQKGLGLGIQELYLSVNNLGSGRARSIEIEVSSSGVAVLTSSLSISSLSPGEGKLLKINVYVPPTAKGGIVRLAVTAICEDTYGEKISTSKTLEFTVGSYETPEVEAELMNESVQTGHQRLSLLLINKGSRPIYNLALYATSPTILVKIPSDQALTKELDPGTDIYISLDALIPQKFQGSSATITLELTYVDSEGVAHYSTKTFTLVIGQERMQAINVFPSKNVLLSGRENALTLTVTNGGPYNISNVRLIFEPEYPLEMNGSNTYLIDKLAVNSSASINITTYVHPVVNELGTQLLLIVEFTDEYGRINSQSESIHLTILPYSKKEAVSVNIEPNSLILPGNSTLTVKVANIGNETISNVELNMNTKTANALLSKASAYISSLKPGEAQSMKTQLIALNQLSGMIPITIMVSYIDSNGLQHSIEYVETIKAVPKSMKLAVDIQPRMIPADSITNATITVRNLGELTFHQVVIRVSVPTASQVSLLSPAELYVGNISKGEEVRSNITLKTPVTSEASKFSILIEIGYYDPQYNYYTKTYSLDLTLVPDQLGKEPVVQLTPTKLKALSNSTLELEVINILNETLNNVQVSIGSISPLKAVGTFNTISLGPIKPGEVKTSKIKVIIPNNPGCYAITLTLRYVDPLGNTHTDLYTNIVRVEPARISLSVDIEPKHLASTNVNNLSIKVMNTGEIELKNIDLELNLPQQLIPLTNTSFFLKHLKPGESINLSKKLKACYTEEVLPVKIDIGIKYVDPSYQTHVLSNSINVELDPASIPKPNVQIFPDELTIGKENRVHVKLVNSCPSPLKDVELSLVSSTNIVLLNGTTVHLGDIEANSARDIYLDIYVPSSSGNSATLSVTFTYINKDTGSYETFKQMKSFLLRGLIDLKLIDSSVIPEKPLPGQPFSITLTITNIGTSAAYALYAVPLIDGLPISVYGSKSIYVGNVEVNTPVTFTITLMITNVTRTFNATHIPSIIPLHKGLKIPILLNYMDNLRTLHNKTIIIPVEISNETPHELTRTPASPLISFPLIWAGVIGTLTIVAVAVILAKRRSRR